MYVYLGRNGYKDQPIVVKSPTCRGRKNPTNNNGQPSWIEMFYLPPSTLSILSTLNNSREIQQLPIKVQKKKSEREKNLSQQVNNDNTSVRRKKNPIKVHSSKACCGILLILYN
jgi:hypothetical protein